MTTDQLTENAPSPVETAGNRRAAASAPAIVPAVDIFEDARGITLYADLPGVPREKLDVRVHDGNLFIEGEAVLTTPANLRVQHTEVRHPRFARAFAVSADFDTSRIEANLKSGVLTLTVPRRDEARPRRVEVTTA